MLTILTSNHTRNFPPSESVLNAQEVLDRCLGASTFIATSYVNYFFKFKMIAPINGRVIKNDPRLRPGTPGYHWQQPCLDLLAKRGHRYRHQRLWNRKTSNGFVREHVELLSQKVIFCYFSAMIGVRLVWR